MNILLLIAVSVGAAPVAAARYDLRMNEQHGRRLVAIVAAETGRFSVAAGESDLSILSGEAARAALLVLETSDEAAVDVAGAAGDEPPSDGKIVIHKMDYAEDLSNAADSRERRVVRRASKESEFAFDFGEAEDPAPTPTPSRADRIIRIHGADADAAADFIEKLGGLDAQEKRRMKDAVGL